MNQNSRQTIHMGINFVFSPMVSISRSSYIDFQKALLSECIELNATNLKEEQEIFIKRDKPSNLEVRVMAPNPPAIGQLLIVSPQPSHDLTMFIQEVEAICAAFDKTWPKPAKNRQIIGSDVTLRVLFETGKKHAFQEIWEERLKQSEESLHALGRPVLGGGLRFVMPPIPSDAPPVEIEVKIESFLRDTKKIFVETQFKWPAPTEPGKSFDPRTRLEKVNNYLETEVVSFIQGG